MDGLCDPTRPRLLAKRLGVNRGLAWRIAGVLSEPGAGEALRKLPRSKSLRAFLDACSMAGGAADAIARAEQAVRTLDDAITASGEERRAIPVLIVSSGLDGQGLAPFPTARQHLFDGARVIWGAEAEMGFRLAMLWPGSPGRVHAAIVKGLVNLELLRHGRWPIAYARNVSGTNETKDVAERPIDPNSTLSLPLIEAFCSPKPFRSSIQLQSEQSREMTRFEVDPQALGRSGRTTVVLGTVIEDVYDEVEDHLPTGAFMMIMETPIQRLQFDLLAHRDLELVRPSELTFCDRLTRPHGYFPAELDSQRLPLDAAPEALDGASPDLRSPFMPWYADLVAHVAQHIGLSLTDFSGYRHELAYPPIASAALMHFWPRRRQAHHG